MMTLFTEVHVNFQHALLQYYPMTPIWIYRCPKFRFHDAVSYRLVGWGGEPVPCLLEAVLGKPAPVCARSTPLPLRAGEASDGDRAVFSVKMSASGSLLAAVARPSGSNFVVILPWIRVRIHRSRTHRVCDTVHTDADWMVCCRYVSLKLRFADGSAGTVIGP